jgi:hypothetical protein
MAVTKKQLRDDLILRFTQGKPSADFEIPNAQIDHWIEEARDAFVSDFLGKTMGADSFSVDPVYINHLTGLSITASSTADINSPTNPAVLTIPPKNDRGVIRVRMKLTADGTYRRVSKIDMYNLENIQAMEFSAPTYENPSFYRIGDIIYIVGPTSTEAQLNTLEIDYTPAMTGAGLAETADFSLAEAHVNSVVAMAEEIGRRELGLIIVDEVNDGTQNQTK